MGEARHKKTEVGIPSSGWNLGLEELRDMVDESRQPLTPDPQVRADSVDRLLVEQMTRSIGERAELLAIFGPLLARKRKESLTAHQRPGIDSL